MSLHKEYAGLLPQEVVDEEDDWLETFDEVVFTPKHKIYNWIKEVEDRVEVHQRNHYGEAPRNLQVLQRPGRQETLLEKHQ